MGIGHWVQAICFFGFSLTLCSAQARAQQPTQLTVMPVPANGPPGRGVLRLDASFSVSLTGNSEARLDRAVQRFMTQLRRETGIPFPARPSGSSNATLIVHTDHGSKEVQEPGEDESYVLEVSPTGPTPTAQTPLGAMHDLQTFLQ